MHAHAYAACLPFQAPKGQRGAKTVDGFEITVGINYFGPLYLTELLIPIIKRSSKPKTITKRIIWVTSLGSQLVNPPIIGEGSGWPGISLVPWDDLRQVSFCPCMHDSTPPAMMSHACTADARANCMFRGRASYVHAQAREGLVGTYAMIFTISVPSS